MKHRRSGRQGGPFLVARLTAAVAIVAVLIHRQMDFSLAISTKKEYNARVKSVAEHVSGVLGNRQKQALDSYINPAVFSVWKEPS